MKFTTRMLYYYTNALLLLIKIMLCTSLSKTFRFKLFLCRGGRATLKLACWVQVRGLF